MGGAVTGSQGGRRHVIHTRLDDAELEALEAKAPGVPLAVAVRLALEAWAGPPRWGPNGEDLRSGSATH